MSDEPGIRVTKTAEQDVWPPPPTAPETEPTPITPPAGLDWGALVPGIVVVLFLLLCLLITLWFLGRLEVL